MNRNKIKQGLILMLLGASLTATGALADYAGQAKPVGTWSLALDAGPFGIPGFALQGIASFHSDGTLMIVDAGDFGSLGTRDTAQLGVWQRSAGGILARTLMLSAAPDTGEPMYWQRVTFALTRGASSDHMVGTINVEVLACTPIPPLPGALTCPDPVAGADGFSAVPPLDVPVEFHRHQAADD